MSDMVDKALARANETMSNYLPPQPITDKEPSEYICATCGADLPGPQDHEVRDCVVHLKKLNQHLHIKNAEYQLAMAESEKRIKRLAGIIEDLTKQAGIV